MTDTAGTETATQIDATDDSSSMLSDEESRALNRIESVRAHGDVVRIEPSKGWVSLRLKEVWLYRELLYFLVWRDIKVRYKQTLIGAAWAILQPFCTMVVFTLFFGTLAQVPSDGVPYAVFSFAALVPWTFFANGLSGASNSLVENANLVRKVYFPRLILPAAQVMSGFLDLLLALLMLLGIMAYYRIAPTINVLWLPALVLLSIVAALGVGLWLSAVNVKYRDVRYTIPFITQLWMFATPVAYGSSLIKNDTWRTLFALNPMVGVVEGFRWALLGTDTAPGYGILVSATVALTVLITGAIYFRRMERQFADVV